MCKALLLFASAWLGGLPAQDQPAAASRLQGRVVDVLGEPVPVAALQVLAGGRVVARTSSDAEGLFLLSRVPLEGAELVAHAPGKAELRQPLRGVRAFGSRIVVLEDGCRLRGRVVDAEGAAVVGASLVLAAGDHRAEAVTGAAGGYEFAAVPLRGAQLRVFANGGWTDRWVRLSADSECDFVLADGGRRARTVRVRGLPADAVARASLAVTSFDQALRRDRGRVPLRADATAAIEVTDTSLVQLAAPGFVVAPAGMLVGPGGQGALEFTVVPVAGGAPAAAVTTMRGRVRDQQDRPVAGLRIVVVDRSYRDAGSTTTAADGSFLLPLRLPAQSFCRVGIELRHWWLEVDPVVDPLRVAFGYGWVDRDVDPNFVLDLRVARAGGLGGELRGRDGGRFPFAEVVVAPAASPRRPFATLVTDQLGAFELGGLPADRYLLTARSARGEVAVVVVDVTAGRTAAVSGWQVQPGGCLEGRLLDSAGRPLPGVELHLSSPALRDGGPPPDGPLTAVVVTDRLGRFRCNGLSPGEWTVATAGAGDAALGSGEVLANATANVELQMQPAPR